MATQFFERQATARTNTAWLVILFLLAVVGIVGGAATVGFFAAEFAMGHDRNMQGKVDPAAIAAIFAVVAAIVILLGSLYQIISLRIGGGSTVAESVGGRPLISDTATGNEKRLLNIVEEMAIASGTPVPPVYLLDEPGINAFAAGYRPSDAVVGVTQGAINNLTREQLQGVIAHEFSHILNGDMRMNIRMIGVLHGILLLGLIGRFMFESIRFMGSSRSSSSDSDKGRGGIVIALVLIGVALLILGWIGSFIGGLIKAAVSRQREYLADASAVQFTRNPEGIGGALKRIAGISAQGRLKHPNAAVASHMFFAQGVFEGLSGLLATHPPLPKRILAIEPNWDGNLTMSESFSPTAVAVAAPMSPQTSMGFAGAGEAGVTTQATDANEVLIPVSVVRDAATHIGAPEEVHREYSSALLAGLDDVLRKAAGDPFAARAVMFALLLDRDPAVASRQLASLEQHVEPAVVQLTQRLADRAADVPEAARLPLVDLALPMLRRMSPPQYQRFKLAFETLVLADNKLSIFEWTLAQVLRRNLAAQFMPTREVTKLYTSLKPLAEPISVLLSTLARVGHGTDQARQAFAIGASKLHGLTPRFAEVSECTFEQLELALKKLRRASERRRGELIDACAACVCADGEVKVREAELIRGIADLLECPLPPLIIE